MSEQQTRDNPVGRSKHLGELAVIFKHRHAKWHHFADFLREIFEDGTVAGPDADCTPSGLDVIPCRHNVGGRNHAALSSARRGPYRSSFDHVRYERPCVSAGTFDENKNPGFVVHDLCVKAVQFLARNNVGDSGDPSRRDFVYDPELDPASYPSDDVILELDADELAEINVNNIIRTARRMALVPDDSSDYGEEFFQQEDVTDNLIEQVQNAVRPASRDDSVSAPGMRSSLDSVGQGTVDRRTTKMRVATLAYLWKFVSDPTELRNEFRKLRSQPNLHVLHLCGCGMCYKTPTGQKVMGCCEASHLILGSSSLNDTHRTYHQMMNMTTPNMYLLQVSIIRGHLHHSGDGVF